MTIYTKAAYTTTQGICEGGMERTNETLERLGLTMDSRVSLQLIMRELGLSDTLYSFCKVCKGCEIEARDTLHAYMLMLTGFAANTIAVTHNHYGPMLAEANAAINKRCSPRKRDKVAKMLSQQYDILNWAFKGEAEPHIRHLLDVYRCMLSDKPDHLAATHASIAFMDWAQMAGIHTEVHKLLCDTLNDLLGPEDA